MTLDVHRTHSCTWFLRCSCPSSHSQGLHCNCWVLTKGRRSRAHKKWVGALLVSWDEKSRDTSQPDPLTKAMVCWGRLNTLPLEGCLRNRIWELFLDCSFDRFDLLLAPQDPAFSLREAFHFNHSAVHIQKDGSFEVFGNRSPFGIQTRVLCVVMAQDGLCLWSQSDPSRFNQDVHDINVGACVYTHTYIYIYTHTYTKEPALAC